MMFPIQFVNNHGALEGSLGNFRGARITIQKMYRLGFSCCILPFLNNYILECNPCSVFTDRICLCCKTLTQELPLPGLCLGHAVSSVSSPFTQVPLSISSHLGCETSFGMDLAGELLQLIPLPLTLAINWSKRIGRLPLQNAERINSLFLCYLPFQTCLLVLNFPFLLRKLEVVQRVLPSLLVSYLPSRFYSMPQPRSLAPVSIANIHWRCQFFNLGVVVSHCFIVCLFFAFFLTSQGSCGRRGSAGKGVKNPQEKKDHFHF